jgi:hypothetical protein
MDSIIIEYKNLFTNLTSSPKLSFKKGLWKTLTKDEGVYRIFEKRSTW